MSEEEIKERLSNHFTLEQLISFKKEWNDAVAVLVESGADLSKIYMSKKV